MQTCEQTKLLLLRKIKSLRELKGWKPKEMAHRLKMSPSGYRDIERGETDIPLSRLLEIAEKLEVRPAEIFDLNEKNVFQVENHGTLENCTLENSSQINSCSPQSVVLQHELEKSRLLVEQKDKEIELLKQQNADLRTMIGLYQKTSSNSS